MIPDRYDRVHRRRGSKQNRQKGSALGQVMPGRHLFFLSPLSLSASLIIINSTYTQYM